jgi:hypothetical protein
MPLLTIPRASSAEVAAAGTGFDEDVIGSMMAYG